MDAARPASSGTGWTMENVSRPIARLVTAVPLTIQMDRVPSAVRGCSTPIPIAIAIRSTDALRNQAALALSADQDSSFRMAPVLPTSLIAWPTLTECAIAVRMALHLLMLIASSLLRKSTTALNPTPSDAFFAQADSTLLPIELALSLLLDAWSIIGKNALPAFLLSSWFKAFASSMAVLL